MKKKILSLLLTTVLVVCLLSGCQSDKKSKGPTIREFIPQEPYVQENLPAITLEQTVVRRGDAIAVTCTNTDEADMLYLFREGDAPGGKADPLREQSLTGGQATFPSNLLTAGLYRIFLCDDDGVYVHDMIDIYVYDEDDAANYAPQSATVSLTEAGNVVVDVQPAAIAEGTIEYRFYWSKEGKRLEGYTPICIWSHSGNEAFTAQFNQGVYMPEEADGMEVVTLKGLSESLFVAAPEQLHVPQSKLLYQFNVLSDIHVSQGWPRCNGFLKKCFTDIIAQGYSSAIFTVGDNTERGQENEYDLLKRIVSEAGEKLPNIYYALGNHDIVYNNNAGYEAQVDLFTQRTGMPGAYYAVELGGIRYILLGSDSWSHLGTIGEDQQQWLREELAKADPGEPVFVILHQPMKDTVAGTLYTKYNKAESQQDFGLLEHTQQLREILKEYPNAIVFTGHTHRNFYSDQAVLLGGGEDATFVACSSVGKTGEAAVSEGLYVEVYEDYVLLRGRDFGKGQWCAAMQILIPIYK